MRTRESAQLEGAIKSIAETFGRNDVHRIGHHIVLARTTETDAACCARRKGAHAAKSALGTRSARRMSGWGWMSTHSRNLSSQVRRCRLRTRSWLWRPVRKLRAKHRGISLKVHARATSRAFIVD